MIVKSCFVLVMVVWGVIQACFLGYGEAESLILLNVWMVGAVILAWMPLIK